MAADSKTGPNGVEGAIGEVTIRLSESLGLQITVNGAMNSPAFLEMASGYLRQYTDRAWDKSWVDTDDEGA